jgi:hypothetical protein
MRLSEGTQTKVKAGNGLSSKVGVHQESVFSLFLFAIVTNDLCEDVREGLLFEILYADGFIMMADSMQELPMKFDE